MSQRGINDEFINYAEYFLTPVYENQCYKIYLPKKRAIKEARKIRKVAAHTILIKRFKGVGFA